MHPFQFVRNRKLWLLVMLVAGALLLSVLVATAQGPRPGGTLHATSVAGTGFTYLGQLKRSGAPVNGMCDFRFALYDALSLGTQVGVTLTAMVPVTGGLFTTALDFGTGAFTGDARWLDIQALCSGDSVYTRLTPRQALTPVPLALALPGLWTQQNPNPNLSPNLIGGYSGNVISRPVVGGTIGGGGVVFGPNRVLRDYGTVGGGYSNTVSGYATTIGGGGYNNASGDESTVAGGYNNNASNLDATISGGQSNTASGNAATVGGGSGNTASGNAATVGGGAYNNANNLYATIGGGDSNIASNDYATIGGGASNLASEQYATIGGGISNTVSGPYGSIGGGYSNTVSTNSATIAGGGYNLATGANAAIPGGDHNFAQGRSSFAAGHRAQAADDGSFVWADSSEVDLSSWRQDLFIVRASGGIFLLLNSNGINGPYCVVSASSPSWSCSSDRNLKDNFTALDPQTVLQQLSRVPITRWTMKGSTVPHIGPMAQDFHAAFGLGEDDTHISTSDAQGVAFAAIQGLYQVVQAKDAQLAAQQKQIVELQTQNASVEARLSALEARVNTANPASNAQPVMLGVVYHQHRANAH